MIERKHFVLEDVAGYLRDGDYSCWHREWQQEKKRGVNRYSPFGDDSPPSVGYEDWLEKVLIPSWESCRPVEVYDDGTIYGSSSGYGVDLDYTSGMDDPELFRKIQREFGEEVQK